MSMSETNVSHLFGQSNRGDNGKEEPGQLRNRNSRSNVAITASKRDGRTEGIVHFLYIGRLL